MHMCHAQVPHPLCLLLALCLCTAACGVKFNLTIQVSPFLLLGLGMDDTFGELPFALPCSVPDGGGKSTCHGGHKSACLP